MCYYTHAKQYIRFKDSLYLLQNLRLCIDVKWRVQVHPSMGELPANYILLVLGIPIYPMIFIASRLLVRVPGFYAIFWRFFRGNWQRLDEKVKVCQKDFNIKGVFCSKSLFDVKGWISRNRPKCKTADSVDKWFCGKRGLQ